MRIVRQAWIATVLVALVSAGCGGGGHAAPKPVKRKPDAAAVLRRYIDAMRPHEQRFMKLSRDVVGAVKGVDETKPDASWSAAAKRLAAASGNFGTLAVDISGVDAPVPLRHVHEQLAEAVDSFGTYVFQVQSALQTGIPSLLASAAAADTTAIVKARDDWAISVVRDATRLGVSIPVWLVPSPAG